MASPIKTVLVNINRIRPAVAPIALDYLGHALKEHGIETDIIDLCFAEDPEREVDRYFAENEVSAVAVTLRNTDDTSFVSGDFFIPQLKTVTDRVKKRSDAPIILGGAGFSVMPEIILDYCDIDIGVWGEGEYALPLLASRLSQGEGIEDVPGAVLRRNGGFVRVPPTYVDLARSDAPRRDVVDNRRYFDEGGMGAVETKRGCTEACVYCADPLGKGTRTRLRSPESVADEVEALLGQGVDHLHLCDSEFNLPPDHALAVCDELAARCLGDRLRWYAYASPAPFTEEAASRWRKAGCAGVNFGVDSASDTVLKALGRHFTVADVIRTAEICHAQGLVFMYDLLLGGPGETRETLRETIETMKRLSPDRVGASLGVRVFPGTRLAARLAGEGPLRNNPNLQGAVTQENDFFYPVFYISSALGPYPEEYLAHVIGGDDRFFVMSRSVEGQNYNYNENTTLVRAIKAGYRGAFWDILRRAG